MSSDSNYEKITQYFSGWFKFLDKADRLSHTPSTYPGYTDKLVSYEFKIRIKFDDFDVFKLNANPENFYFKFDNFQADPTYAGAAPQRLITWQVYPTADYFFRVRSLFPNPVTDDDKGELIIDMVATPKFLAPYYLDFTGFNLKLHDIEKNETLLNLDININAAWTKILITDRKSPKLTTKELAGNYFTITKGY